MNHDFYISLPVKSSVFMPITAKYDYIYITFDTKTCR